MSLINVPEKPLQLPDIAALGVELAIARGAGRGNQAGIEARLPSARLHLSVVEIWVGKSVFKSSVLDMSRKRKLDLEDQELEKRRRKAI